MAAFMRGLSPEFVRALEALAKSKQSWWRDVLEDKGLIIAVRNQYLNVYWQGNQFSRSPSRVSASSPEHIQNTS